MLCQNCHPGSTDLVGGVTVHSHPVAAYQHRLDPAVFHHLAGHVVTNQGHIHAGFFQFIAGEPCPLQQGTGFVGEHLKIVALFFAQQDRSQSGAVAACSQLTGVAVGQQTIAIPEQGQAVSADFAAHFYVLSLHRQGFCHRVTAIFYHLCQPCSGPAQVHSRGAGAV